MAKGVSLNCCVLAGVVGEVLLVKGDGLDNGIVFCGGMFPKRISGTNRGGVFHVERWGEGLVVGFGVSGSASANCW